LCLCYTVKDFPVRTEEAVSDLLHHNNIEFESVQLDQTTGQIEVKAKAASIEKIVSFDQAFIANVSRFASFLVGSFAKSAA
jgi:hypothetical protein